MLSVWDPQPFLATREGKTNFACGDNDFAE